MVQSLTLKNYLSFRDEVTFSFEATRDRHLEDYQVVEVVPKVRLLKLGIVYGYNAYGKSNLLQAFDFLHDFWFEIKESKSEETDVIPFLLDNTSSEKPTFFKLIFYSKQIKYAYSLSLTESEVLSEKLDYYPSVQPANIFERSLRGNLSTIKFGPKINIKQNAIDEITLKCLSNMSFFAAYDQINIEIEEIENALTWMKTHFMHNIVSRTPLTRYAEDLLFTEKISKQDLVAFLQRADFNISDISSQYVTEHLPDSIVESLTENENIPLNEIKRIKKEKTITLRKVEFEHKVKLKNKVTFFTLSKLLQSEGTIRIFGLAVAMMRAIENNAFLCVDEIESKMHPHLIEFMLQQFLKQSDRSQLLVTTHYDGLLEEDDLIRKDNIWFTEKDESGATNLYPLTDFKGLNRISSILKAYKYGKFGAVPNFQ